jgi:DNA helicase II / ATP-dependent DNA helicase PcrA
MSGFVEVPLFEWGGEELSETAASVALTASEIADRLELPRPTEQQRAVIEAPLAPSLVVAGAGSGKTETMANRVVWLLANGLVGVPQILGLTFTRKAAGELATRIRLRIEQLSQTGILPFEIDPFDAPTVATYNSFANSIFRENALLIGREPESAVLSEASAWQLARRLVVQSTDDRLVELDKGVDDVTRAVISLSRALSENVADGDAVASMARRFGELTELPAGSNRVAGAYNSVKRATSTVGALPALLDLAAQFAAEKVRRGFVEYSDQVALALAACERVPAVVSELRSRYRVVLLDEYQDTSVVQTRLLSLLFSGHPVMAVGDPHQSIYGWRGASAANLGRFSRDFTGSASGASEFALSTSWRNPARVLEAANVLVAPLSASSPVHVEVLGPRPGAVDGTVDLRFEQTVVDEAAAIADWLAPRLERRDRQGAPPSAAILCRSIKKIDVFTAALSERGIRYHVLGLGGLLEQPVVADLVSALRVIHDPTAGSELIRLLTGGRWRVGPRDIKALRGLASWLGARDHALRPLDAEVRQRLRQSVVADENVSLVDALDYLAEARAEHRALSEFSATGLDRMRRAGKQLAYLRSRVGLDLQDLVTLVSQELMLDIEVAANDSAQLGQASLDAFAEQISRYLASDELSTLGAFLSWLAEAERLDNLSPRSEDAEPGTVQLLTIHGAKGLEWDLVAVPRMVDGELPGPPQSKRGWLEFGGLPYEFRGDATELPVLDWRNADSQKQFDAALGEFEDAILERHAAEQRRLAYVAVTRAKSELLLAGSWWSTQTRPRGPGAFLLELEAAGTVEEGQIPDLREEDTNPLALSAQTTEWPLDPLGARRTRVVEAAEAVRRAPAHRVESAYSHDIDLLLAERARLSAGFDTVDLPARIPASRFKDYVSNPQAVAAQLRRPMPEKPFRQTRLGTLFHSWVEQRSEVTGATETIDASVLERDDDPEEQLLEQADLERLQTTFEASPWAALKPEEVEIEIHVPLAGHIIVCKLDAVYRVADPEWDYQIVDWKTGAPPRDDADLQSKQLQLALYRLAFSRWKGIDPNRIDALFYFVTDDLIVRPARLYSEEELESLWSSATGFMPPTRP